MTLPTQPDIPCPSCATPNRAGARFCRKCGAELPASAPARIASAPSDAPTAPAGGAPPTLIEPPPSPYPTATYVPPPPPPRPGPPWVLIGVGAGVLLLLLACVVGGMRFLGGRGQATLTATPAASAVAEPPTAAPSPSAAPSRTPEPATAEPPTAEPTLDTSPAETAQAEAAATTVAQRQTAIALALATQIPTAAPTPAALQPEPGTLQLADYQSEIKGFSQRLFETYDRGERTKAIWSQFENDSVRARLRNNFYALTLKGPGRNVWETWDRDLGDTYNIELAVAFETTGVPTTVGIAFDVQPEGDNGVFFEVFNDRTWQLRTVRDGSLVPAGTTERISLPALQDGIGTNVLWVVRRPDQVQLWINSTHVATVPAGPFAGGRAGVIASSRDGLDGDATVIADNFRVRTP